MIVQMLTRLVFVTLLLATTGCASWGRINVTSDPLGALAHAGPSDFNFTGGLTGEKVIGRTPASDWLMQKANVWGIGWAWVEWPDGVKSAIKRGKQKDFHFVKADYLQPQYGRMPQIELKTSPASDEDRMSFCDSSLPPRTWNPSTIAIADLIAYTLSPGEAKTLTDKLFGTMAQTDYFSVLSRSDMKVILDEQKFQRTDNCDDSVCLVEMGKLLAVEKIIGGSIGKVGQTFSVALRLVDVETGRVELTVNKALRAEPDKLLTLIEVAGKELAFSYSSGRKAK